MLVGLIIIGLSIGLCGPIGLGIVFYKAYSKERRRIAREGARYQITLVPTHPEEEMGLSLRKRLQELEMEK